VFCVPLSMVLRPRLIFSRRKADKNVCPTRKAVGSTMGSWARGSWAETQRQERQNAFVKERIHCRCRELCVVPSSVGYRVAVPSVSRM